MEPSLPRWCCGFFQELARGLEVEIGYVRISYARLQVSTWTHFDGLVTPRDQLRDSEGIFSTELLHVVLLADG